MTRRIAQISDLHFGRINPAVVEGLAHSLQEAKPDLIVANRVANAVSVLVSNADGTFAAFVPFAAGADVQAVTAADFDADGKVDLAVVNGTPSNTATLLSNLAPYPPPDVVTGGANGVAQATATVAGSVIPHGQATTAFIQSIVTAWVTTDVLSPTD